MFPGISQLASLFLNAGALGEKLNVVQSKLRERKATGAAGAGLVTVEMNGLFEVLHCRIDPRLSTTADRELIEDMTVAATNEAMAKAKQIAAEVMQEVLGEMPGVQQGLMRLMGGGR